MTNSGDQQENEIIKENYMSQEMEEWKDVPDSDCQVLSLGRMRRVMYLNPKPHTKHDGYMKCGFRRGSRIRTFLVHTLVAELFLGKRPGSMQINHKDSNKQNNTVSNLEYVTRKQNAEHAVQNGRYRRGETHPKTKLTKALVRDIKNAYSTGRYTFQEIGKRFGVSKATAHKIIRGKTWL